MLLNLMTLLVEKFSIRTFNICHLHEFLKFSLFVVDIFLHIFAILKLGIHMNLQIFLHLINIRFSESIHKSKVLCLLNDTCVRNRGGIPSSCLNLIHLMNFCLKSC